MIAIVSLVLVIGCLLVVARAVRRSARERNTAMTRLEKFFEVRSD